MLRGSSFLKLAVLLGTLLMFLENLDGQMPTLPTQFRGPCFKLGFALKVENLFYNILATPKYTTFLILQDIFYNLKNLAKVHLNKWIFEILPYPRK